MWPFLVVYVCTLYENYQLIMVPIHELGPYIKIIYMNVTHYLK